MNRCRRGATLVEACIAGALLVLILGAIAFTISGARRVENVAAAHLGLMESVALAMHQLRTDLRQLSFVPAQPVVPNSMRTGGDYRSVILRRSSAALVGDVLGSAIVLVEYRLVPVAGKADRFHLLRVERTASGKPLPGKTVSREERLFRSFELTGATFLYKEDDVKDDRILHVALQVAFRDKEHVFTNMLAILRPEEPHAKPRMPGDPAADWAAKLTVQAEMPGDDVVAPAAAHSGALPEPGDEGEPQRSSGDAV